VQLWENHTGGTLRFIKGHQPAASRDAKKYKHMEVYTRNMRKCGCTEHAEMRTYETSGSTNIQNPQECGHTEPVGVRTMSHKTRRSVDTQNTRNCGHTKPAGVRTYGIHGTADTQNPQECGHTKLAGVWTYRTRRSADTQKCGGMEEGACHCTFCFLCVPFTTLRTPFIPRYVSSVPLTANTWEVTSFGVQSFH